MKTGSLIVAACAAFLLAGMCYAAADQDSAKAEGGYRNIWAKLGFNQTQQNQMKEFFKEGKDKVKANIEASKDLRQIMKEEFLKPNPDPAILDNYAGQLAKLHEQMIKDRIASLFKAKQFLTPDQFSKVLDMEDKMAGGFPHGDKQRVHNREKHD
jgi:Spy/CpxP family protein refolding chaperone